MYEICLHCHWLSFSSFILNFEQCGHSEPTLKSFTMQMLIFSFQFLFLKTSSVSTLTFVSQGLENQVQYMHLKKAGS